MIARLLVPMLVFLGLALELPASQVEPRVLYSPFTNRSFEVLVIPVASAGRRNLGVGDEPDMGIDDDGCRHSSGINEYEHYVVTDPTSYFSALAIEWGDDGRFRNTLTREFREWVTSRDGFNSQFVTDRNNYYARARRMAQRSGERLPPFENWLIPQTMIPLATRYQLALRSYQRREATHSFQAKLALNGAWALRVMLNRPLVDGQLRGGIEEVNERLARHFEEGQAFDLERVLDAYRRIFGGRRLTDEGAFVAGITLVGLTMRTGDRAETEAIFDTLAKRYSDRNRDLHTMLSGVLRERRHVFTSDYLGFLSVAVEHFTRAIANEEFSRPRLPGTLLAVAECHRRLGNLSRAYDWYLALANLPEGQPRMREEIRAAGGAPGAEASYAMLLGWRADSYLERLSKAGVVHSGTIGGRDAALLQAVVNEQLGGADYVSPTWQPRSGGDHAELTTFLHNLGFAVLEYVKRSGDWPESLDQMWVDGVLRDRNAFNRFHCPVSGKPLAYRPIGGQIEELPARLVLLATTAPVPTNQGPRYGAFLSNLRIEWFSEAPVVGEFAPARASE